MARPYLLLLGTVLLLCLIASCNVPEGDVDLQVEGQEWAIPLINSRIDVSTVTDNTEGTSITVDSDGSLIVNYRGDAVQRGAEDIFVVVDTLYRLPVIDGIRVPVPETEDGDKVAKMIFGPTSRFWFEHTNTHSSPVTATVTLPDFNKDGTVFAVSIEAEPGATVTSDTIELQGVEVLPSNDSLAVALDVVDASGTEIPSFFQTLMYIENLDLLYLEGLIQERVFPIDGDIITVGIFDNWISGGIDFVNPRLTIDVTNGFGMPVSAIFNEMSITTTEGVRLDIESTLIDDGITMDYPSLAEAGQTKNTVFAFDKDNSNIREIFNERAAKVTYDIDALVNPDTQEDQGYVSRSSFFKIDVNVEVPLEGRVNDFVLEADTELDLIDLNDAKKADFKVIFDNGFPLDVFTQAYFIDADGQVLDSLFADGIELIAGTTVGPDGRVVSDERSIFFLPFDEQRLTNILTTTKLRVRARLDTPDSVQGFVDIYEDYGLGIKIGAIIVLD